MSEQERPEWAKEFEGWRMGSSHLYRTTSRHLSMEISPKGVLWVRNQWLDMDTPEAALRVANCIAKELGGWPGEES